MNPAKLLKTGIAIALLSSGLATYGAVHESVTYTNVVSDGELGDPVNEVRVFTATGLTAGNTPYNLGLVNLAGTISSVETFDYGQEGLIQVTHPNSTMRVVQMFPGEFTFTTLTGTAALLISPGSSAAGQWEFRFYEDYDDGGNGAVDKIWNSIQIDFTDDLPTPPSSEDKGVVCNPGMSFTTEIDGPTINWFRIEVPESTGGNDRYLDVDTQGTALIDTEIGLYSSSGELMADDDDDGDGLTSQLTFGPDAGPRTGPGGDAEDYDGRDGNLASGTYYLAVGQYDTLFGSAFDVVSDGVDTGTVTVNFYTNMVCAEVSGTVTLQNLDGSPEGCEVTIEIREVGSTIPLEVQTVALDPTGAYTIPTSLPSGTYDVTAKGGNWLRQLNGSVTFSSNGAADVDFSLVNGDADPDNEVNLVDIGAISAAFGSVEGDTNWNPNADLDKDGEVNLVDYGIAAANFGQAGDE